MKTSPTVYLIKSILTAARLPSAFNYDSFPNVPAEYQSQCADLFLFCEGGLWAAGACAEPLPPSHFTHKEWNEDQQLNSCSLGAFLHGQERRGLQPTHTHPSPSADLQTWIWSFFFLFFFSTRCGTIKIRAM